MASKVINGKTANENITSRVVCSSTAYADGNYSLVSLSGRLSRTNEGYTTGGDGTFYLTVDGQKWENSGYYEITYQSDTPVITVKDIKIPHNADGSKEISISFTGAIPISTLTSISCSGKFKLDDIPRESALSVNKTTAKAGDSITLTLNRAASSYTHDILLKMGSRTKTLTGIGASTTWTIPKEWQDQFPSASSSTLSITATTKSGTTSIGTSTASVKVTPSSDAAPDVKPTVVGVNLYWDLFIESKSKATIEANATGKYGASISRYKITGGGYSGTGKTFTTGILNVSGNVVFTITATDSRGLSTTETITIHVEPYEAPGIYQPLYYRADLSGQPNTAGRYIYVSATPIYSDCQGNNTVSITAEFKIQGGSYSEPVSLLDGPAIWGDGTLSDNDYYYIRITVTDYFGSVKKEYAVEPSAFRAAFGTKAAGILRYPPEGGSGLYTTSVNGVWMDKAYFSSTKQIIVQTRFEEWKTDGAAEFQNIFTFFADNDISVFGMFTFDDFGNAFWSGNDAITIEPKATPGQFALTYPSAISGSVICLSGEKFSLE